MNKYIRHVDEKRGIVQLTTDDERWYIRESIDPNTGIPNHTHLPSSSWISSYYPKGTAYYKWLAEHGWDEAEAIKKERGKEGTKVHKAVECLLLGEKVELDRPFLNPSTRQMEALTPEEYAATWSFTNWFETLTDFELIKQEYVVWSDKYRFAGTLDLLARINGEYWILDFKTSQYIWPSHEIQLASYKHGCDVELPEEPRLAVLQLGYKRNKAGFKFTEVKDEFDLFLSAQKIWAKENGKARPAQKEYPLSLSINLQNHVSGRKV